MRFEIEDFSVLLSRETSDGRLEKGHRSDSVIGFNERLLEFFRKDEAL